MLWYESRGLVYFFFGLCKFLEFLDNFVRERCKCVIVGFLIIGYVRILFLVKGSDLVFVF